jgi:hypothetical protein
VRAVVVSVYAAPRVGCPPAEHHFGPELPEDDAFIVRYCTRCPAKTSRVMTTEERRSPPVANDWPRHRFLSDGTGHCAMTRYVSATDRSIESCGRSYADHLQELSEALLAKYREVDPNGAQDRHELLAAAAVWVMAHERYLP